MKTSLKICLIALATCLFWGCKDVREAEAERLYEAALKYTDNQDYTHALELLQRISIEYNETEVAVRAQREYTNLESLYQMDIDNQRLKASKKFTRIALALDQYQLRYISFPLTLKDLEKLPPDHRPDLTDEWGNPFHYRAYASEGVPEYEPDNYALASFGKDGLPGGTGLDQDRFYQKGVEVGQLVLP